MTLDSKDQLDNNQVEKCHQPGAEQSPVSEPPDGGIAAWLQVAGSFCLFLNTWGLANTYGVYQTYYETHLNHQTASNISWICSLQGALLFFGSAVTGPFFDLGYLRTMLYFGTFLIVFGMMMTSICTQYWQIFLAQGLTVGLGFGCLFLPSVAIVSQYFTTRKGFAFGIASTGTSIGGVVYPVVFRQLQQRVGFGWATRTIAFIMVATMAVPLFGMRLRSPSSTKRRDFLDLSAFKNLPFFVFCLGTFFGFMGVFVTFFYIQLYSIERTPTNAYLSSYLLSIINASAIIGRLIPNFFADKVGPLNIQIIFAFTTAVLCFGWIGIRNTAGTIVFCVLYGLSSGSFTSLPGVTVINLSKNLSKIGIQLGMSFVITGCGQLIGEPIAGAILRGSGGWVGLQIWCGVLLAASGVCSLAAGILKAGTAFKAKA